jgi:exopolysaccharide production protein ExoQ
MSSATLAARKGPLQENGIAEQQEAMRRSRWAWERADFRARLVRSLCALALSACFWFSVPYGIPDVQTNGLQLAASNAAQSFEGSRSREIAMPLIAGFAMFLLWRFPRRGAWKGHLRWPVMLFVLWAVASAGWSQVPSTTGKRLVVFLADALFAYALARVATLLEMALWGFLTTGAVALISLGVDVFYQHTFAPLDPDYRFMGVMEANYQAMNLLVGLLCGMTLLQRRPRWAKWLIPALCGEAVLLVLTRSRLGTLLAFVLLAVIAVRWVRQQWQYSSRALGAAVLLAVSLPALVLVVGQDPQGVAERVFMMGRHDTENTSSLSNRAPLWSELVEFAKSHPLAGFGYAAFWTPARVDNISLDQGWAVPNAHNTYLDQWLSLGVVGAVLYCLSLWGGCAIAWQRHRRERTPESLLAALLLTWLCLEGLAESVPLDPYLPTMLGYACLLKMCLSMEGDVPETDEAHLVQGLPLETQPA